MALALLLPFLTGQVPLIGTLLSPMHLPVFLCGLICGWKYGLLVGLVAPILRSCLFGMPPMYPVAIAMCFELATYGALAGFLYEKSRWQCVWALLRCLAVAMLAGRLVWGIAELVLIGIGPGAMTWDFFWSSAVTMTLPGIVLQLVLIPAIMTLLNRTGLVPFRRRKNIHAAESNT